MRWSTTLWLAVSGCLFFSATAAAQTLVELAQKEKARVAEIAKTEKAAEVIDAEALSKFRTEALTAMELSGSVSQSSQAEAAELGRPLLENPNRPAEFTPSPSSSSRARQGTADMGRGWSSGGEYSPDARGWSKAGDHPPSGRGWSRGGENPVDERGWSDRPAADRGSTIGGDYSSSGRGWTQGGENPAASERGWSQRPSSP